MEFIPIANPCVGREETEAVSKVIKSGWVSMGRKVQEFEKLICEYLGVSHVVAFNSGTASLHAALLAAGVKPGDEVVVPTLSYISSANAILYCGAKPIFCESDPLTFNVTAEELLRRITAKTTAIMTVDLKGMPVDYDSILDISSHAKIPIVSDSAESFGAVYKERKVGIQCPIHSFSFFANKNITMGEGGAITTHDVDWAKKCRIIRNQGQSVRYEHIMIGHNYRPTDYAAAFGIEQVKKVEWIMTEKQKIAEFYNNHFSDHPLIKVPFVPEYVSRHSWYLYCLSFASIVDRDKVVSFMEKERVDSRLSFPPIHLQPIYRQMFGYKEGDYATTERFFNRFIDIPCWINMGLNRMKRVVHVVLQAVEASTSR